MKEENKPLDELLSDISSSLLLEKASNITGFYDALGDNIEVNDKITLVMLEFYPELM